MSFCSQFFSFMNSAVVLDVWGSNSYFFFDKNHHRIYNLFYINIERIFKLIKYLFNVFFFLWQLCPVANKKTIFSGKKSFAIIIIECLNDTCNLRSFSKHLCFNNYCVVELIHGFLKFRNCLQSQWLSSKFIISSFIFYHMRPKKKKTNFINKARL